MGQRLLWVSPLPPARSGVSDYALELLPALGGLATVRVVLPPGASSPPPELGAVAELEIVESSVQQKADEIALVHLGNNPMHRWVLPWLRRPGAVAVMHDLVLHHLLIECTLAQGDEPAYREAVTRAHGRAGEALAAARRVGIAGRRDPFLFPARRAFLAGLRGVVVHSEWGAAAVRGDVPSTVRVAAVPLTAADPGVVDSARVRRELGIDLGDLVVMHLGFLTPAKGISEVLAALAAVRATGVPARLVLVGDGPGDGSLDAAAAALDLSACVSRTGWLDQERMLRVAAAADLGVVLRTPSAGETSAAVLRFLACGTPVAVCGLHQYLEWPEEAAPRVTPGPGVSAELARWIARAWAERGGAAWTRRREAARSAYLSQHTPANGANCLLRALAVM